MADINAALMKVAEQATDTYRCLYGIPKAPPNVVRFTHCLDLGALGEEVEVTVEGRYTDGYPGNHEEPAEEDSFDVECVFLDGLDIFPRLQMETCDEIIEAAMEDANSA